MAETRPEYSTRGRVEQKVLLGLRHQLQAVDKLRTAAAKDENLGDVSKKFGLDRTPEEIRAEMQKIVGDEKFNEKLYNNPKFLAKATELTLLLIEKTEKDERLNDEPSTNFMHAIDAVYRNDPWENKDRHVSVQKTRTKAVKILTDKFNNASQRIEFDDIKSDKPENIPTKLGEVTALLSRADHDELANFVLETNVKNLESEYKKTGLETEVKEEKKEELVPDFTSEEDQPIQPRDLNIGPFGRRILVGAGITFLATSAYAGLSFWAIDALSKGIISQVDILKMGGAVALLGASAAAIHLYIKRGQKETIVEAPATIEATEALQEIVEGLTLKGDLKLRGIAYKVGNEMTGGSRVINDDAAPISECLRPDVLFVLPVITYSRNAGGTATEANTNLISFHNGNRYMMIVDGDGFDLKYLRNANDDGETKPALDIINAITEIHRANALGATEITGTSYLVYNNFCSIDALNDLMADVKNNKINNNHFVENSTIVYTR